MKPAVLMVDVDGVVVRHPDPAGWSARIEEDLGVPRQALQERFFKPCWDDVVHGRAALRDRLAPALAEIAPHVSCDQLIRYWFEGDAARARGWRAALWTQGAALSTLIPELNG